MEGGMRELVELVFGKTATIDEKILIARNSSIISSFLTEEFSQRINDVVSVSKLIINYKWEGFLDVNCRNMLSTHMNYMMFVMAACLLEHESKRKIFDSFISVCALVIYLNEEILEKIGVDFSDLNPDIFMVFYRNILKRSFHRRRDFLRFGEYIRGHEYLAWKINLLTLPAKKRQAFVINTIEDLERSHEVPNDMHITIEETGISLAQEVLSTTSVELPTLPNEPDLIRRLVASRKKKIVKETEIKAKVETASTFQTLNVTSHRYSSSNSNSKTNFDTEHQQNIAQYENIIQAVIRHNHSKRSGQEKMENQIHKEAEGILKSLNNTIKSLIEALDECDKE